ncbi:hypothetical protein BpHYR1_021847 [Brachionus plicatilis]|uniref:Uncharacterized protein n=1 Tax=Brachionus plicatilis TaxID=10195 RepID=A0A3M7T487_BRAPC|nr:hypothetical protein BpHYR1_021847 [Brachionus plicatilis]
MLINNNKLCVVTNQSYLYDILVLLASFLNVFKEFIDFVFKTIYCQFLMEHKLSKKKSKKYLKKENLIFDKNKNKFKSCNKNRE